MTSYRLVYADPPRLYKNKKTGGSMCSGSESKYSVMTDEVICTLPISNIVDTNAILFLWATVPLLPETLGIMDAWGFKYKTTVVWRKVMSLGMGFWFRGQVELCLLGIRGRPKAFRCQKPNFIQSKARSHSQKPEEMYQLIEELGIFPRIELFAGQKREGWDSLGNAIDGRDIRVALAEKMALIGGLGGV